MKIRQVLNSVNARPLRRLLRGLYHRKGPGRKPYNPSSMLKAQLLKHMLRIPSDRSLAISLKDDRRVARACGFRKHTPSHGLFTHFRKRLGENTYHLIFDHLLRRLVELFRRRWSVEAYPPSMEYVLGTFQNIVDLSSK